MQKTIMSLGHCDFRLHDVKYLSYCHMQEINISYHYVYNEQLSCEIARNIVWYLADEAVGRVG